MGVDGAALAPPPIVAAAPGPSAGAADRPIVLAQLENPPAPLQIQRPPPKGGTEETGAPAKPSQPAAPAPTLLKPEIDLSLLRTKDLSLLYFDPAETYLVPHVARSLENSMAFQKRIYDWTPWERATVLLKDFADYGNAGARATPNNTLLLDIAPLSQEFETLSAGERFFTLSNHELTHVATMDVWNQTDAFWRHFFGGKPAPLEDHPETILYNYLATPRVTSPRWYLEGSAVFMETWMAGGYGRAQGAYDEMVFRAMVRDHAKFYSPLGLESEGDQVDFQVGVNDYLYGARFMSYLGLTRSPEKVIQWLRRDKDSAGYYETQFKRVFGEPLDQAWNEWIDWEHKFQTENLASVQAFPTTPTRRLFPMALGSASRSFYDPATHSLIGGFRYPGVIADVAMLSLDTGKIRRLTDIKGPSLYRVTSLAYDPATKTAWYTADNQAYRDLMQIDTVSGKTQMLIRDGRIGDLAFNRGDRSLWGLRHLNGLVTLVRLAAPYKDWTQVHTFDYGEVPFDLDISPDGTLLSASVGEVDGDQSVRVFRLADITPDAPPTPVAQFRLGQSTPEGFVFSPDGRYLFGSAYYTGVSNIYRFELATQKVEAVSNAVTGFFRPIPQADGSLIVYEFTGHGFAPVSIDPKPLDDLGAIKFLGTEVAEQHPIVKSWAVGSPAKVPLDDMVTRRGKYDPLAEMHLGAAYPVVEAYKGRWAFGWHAIVEDPLEFDQLTATLAYSPSNRLPEAERWHVDIAFHTINWRLRYWHNDANFYDLTGPIDRSRKGDAFIVGYQKTFVYDPPRQLDFSAELAQYIGLDTLPGAQNVPTAEDKNITALRAGLKYENTNKSLGAVDYERGWRWNLAFEGDYSGSKVYPSLHGGVGFGAPIGWAHSSVWMYDDVGVIGGEAANPLGAFYMGAFGNNWVDAGEVKRYRQFDSFPGFDIDAISARAFAKELVEWNLPPVRLAGIGQPSFFFTSARPALFGGMLEVKPPTGKEQTFETLGGQLDFNFTVALRLPMTLSVGVAHGFGDEAVPGRTEVMASVKIL